MAGLTTPRRCWAPKGLRPEVGMQIVREYAYAFGGVSPHDGTLDSLVLPVVTAEAMSIFLGEVARRHPGEFILMFLDGAGWHRANDLKVLANMRLEGLPPYSPQLNPVEHIWDEIREKWFANEVFNGLVEDLQTNSLGTENVINAAIEAGVKQLIVLNTDKAVYPINAMGISKAMMEKIAVAKSRIAWPDAKICITHCGNVMASCGSVILLFIILNKSRMGWR